MCTWEVLRKTHKLRNRLSSHWRCAARHLRERLCGRLRRMPCTQGPGGYLPSAYIYKHKAYRAAYTHTPIKYNVFICIYVYMHNCIYIYIYIIYISPLVIYLYICIYHVRYIYICIYIYIEIHIYMYIYIYIHRVCVYMRIERNGDPISYMTMYP